MQIRFPEAREKQKLVSFKISQSFFNTNKLCCCVLLCVSVCCCVAVCCCVSLCVAVCCCVLLCVAVCCCVLLCVAMCCYVLICVVCTSWTSCLCRLCVTVDCVCCMLEKPSSSVGTKHTWFWCSTFAPFCSKSSTTAIFSFLAARISGVFP